MPVETTPDKIETSTPRLPLRRWELEFARRWNGGSYSLFVLHGNIFDVFPVQKGVGVEYLAVRAFLARRLFPDRAFLLFYDVADGLTFGTAEMQKRFFEWLEIYDQVENTNFRQTGPPREFLKLAPLLRRFFTRVTEEEEVVEEGENVGGPLTPRSEDVAPAPVGAPKPHPHSQRRGVTLIIEFPEKIIPAAEESGATSDERTALVTLLKWAESPEMRREDVGVILVTESAAELNADLLQNPNVAQVRIDLPDSDERLRFIESGVAANGAAISDWSDLSAVDLAARTAGLNLLRIQHLLAEATRNSTRVTSEHVSASKKRLIEEYCQGLVRFKDPKPGVSLDLVATHEAAKKKLREIAWLFKNGKTDVVERGILVPGRVGVGKSFLIDCFASECGLPVMEIGEFRSKWVGDTERQQMRILMTVRALGPVIVVVDEADAVFGSREGDGDSGVSGRVFAAFAAHIGDSSLRGREVWVAMTSRPDLLAIDMKRQGRFGLSLPLFPAQSPEDVVTLFNTVGRVKKITLGEEVLAFVREELGVRPLTGSDVEAILTRAKERAVLAGRDHDVQLEDLKEAVSSFVDPLDPNLLALQELAAVLSCSDKRYLPPRYRDADRAALMEEFARLKIMSGRR